MNFNQNCFLSFLKVVAPVKQNPFLSTRKIIYSVRMSVSSFVEYNKFIHAIITLEYP